MKRSRITLNYNNMMKARLGSEGVTDAHLASVKGRIRQAHLNLKQKREDGQMGFMYLPYDMKAAAEVTEAAGAVRARFENFVMVGVGGPAAGVKALHGALAHPNHNLLTQEKRKGPRIFFLDNADPEGCTGLLDVIDPKKTIVNVVSKSGSTAETAACLKVLWNRFEKKVTAARLKDHFVVTTGREKGFLRGFAVRHGLASYQMQDNVAGRFSLLSQAGLFPLACAGVDIAELLRGAAYMDTLVSAESLQKNPAYMGAALHYISAEKFKRNITVMMPYASALAGIPAWFAQLWAGSLGKKFSTGGRIVNTGLTPVTALGTTDQHSQCQLYMEGPYDKVVTFIRTTDFRQEADIPRLAGEDGSVSYLTGNSMAAVMDAGLRATGMAMAANRRANMTVTLPGISEFTLGQLVHLLEVEAAFLAELYEVNAFDSPGPVPAESAAGAMLGSKDGGAELKSIGTGRDSAKYII